MLRKINESKTIKLTESMLKLYPRFHRIEKREMILMKSPSLSGMPKSKLIVNNAGKNTINKIDARSYCDLIRQTIKALDNEDFKAILEQSYIKPVYNNQLIADQLGVSSPTFYKMRKKALLSYAEICPGMPDLEDTNNGEMIDLVQWC